MDLEWTWWRPFPNSNSNSKTPSSTLPKSSKSATQGCTTNFPPETLPSRTTLPRSETHALAALSGRYARTTHNRNIKSSDPRYNASPPDGVYTAWVKESSSNEIRQV